MLRIEDGVPLFSDARLASLADHEYTMADVAYPPQYDRAEVLQRAATDPTGFVGFFSVAYPENNIYRALFEAIAFGYGDRSARRLLDDLAAGQEPLHAIHRASEQLHDRYGPLQEWLRAALEAMNLDTAFSPNRFEEFSTVGALLAGTLAPPANEGQDRLRILVHEKRYDEAQAELRELALDDVSEFGFLTWQDSDRDIVSGLWSALAEGNELPFGTIPESSHTAPDAPVEEDVEPEGSAPHQATAHPRRHNIVPSAARSPVQAGEALEEATVQLLERFFQLSPDSRSNLLNGIRRQNPGIQFGHDVRLDCSVAGRPNVRCHIECKNLTRPVRTNDVIEKLWQTKTYYRDSPIDHWILISPHADPSNDLEELLRNAGHDGTFPFKIQVWSPQSGVRELFSLDPVVYAGLYGEPPDGSAPSKEQIVANIRARLMPHVRLDESWQRYLRTPALHCIGAEKPAEFAALHERHVDVRAADVDGSVLEGTLMERVIAWLAEPAGPGRPALLLLADFGEGKSFFTYELSRYLCERFLEEPEHGILPLRIPLGLFSGTEGGRALLVNRLDQIGVTLTQWTEVAASTRCVVILDGFDEMSKDLSTEAVEANIDGLGSCLREITGSDVRIVVTSRGRIFEAGRNRERILDQLGQPAILQLSSVARTERIRHLESLATDPADRRRLTRLRSLYDPIGLAAKPLFLSMIWETLPDLPEDEFSELILYSKYVERSLRHKLDFMINKQVLKKELLENLKSVLEQVAVRLQQADHNYIYLTEFGGSERELAAALWKTSDGTDEAPTAVDAQNATAQVGIRSLLKAAPAPDTDRWPVTFFHRSMQEYFVASALLRALREDRPHASTILDALPPLPEIVHFTASMIREAPDREHVWGVLESFTRSATLGLPTRYLGGHAITLLHASGGAIPSADCARLRLDYASLAGVNLSRANLAGTSLRHANLDNANLENSDLTGADLEGVRLEETSIVVGVAALDDDRIVAAYDDRTIRTWQPRFGRQWESLVAAITDHAIERIEVTPGGRLLVCGDSSVTVLSPRDGKWATETRFTTKPPMRPPSAGRSDAFYVEELDEGATRAVRMNTVDRTVLDRLLLVGSPVSYTQLDGWGFVVAQEEWLHALVGDPIPEQLDHFSPGIRCLDIVRSSGHEVLLTAGCRDGSLLLFRIVPDLIEPVWKVRRHGAMINSVAFIGTERIVSGGRDRAVKLTRVDTGEPLNRDASMQLTLRCRGARYDQVRTERERSMIARAAQS
ncbi:NACHT domain-containing protein [Actinoplanes italicus]|uniref:NACHT domain-containing protein n=1 Tax=Actinoplanes italicus TaxID=113567 RepID=UPI001473A2C5|nr:pentapeptide repeat-containing protein [Actinoplanes italicus]